MMAKVIFTSCHFIFSGTRANSLNFQLYLLEGLARWNADRAASALKVSTHVRSYDVKLKSSFNSLSQDVLGYRQIQEFQAPGKYTGNNLVT